jgi:outer membrane protein OmpA-like peptidoglycan-associated protein
VGCPLDGDKDGVFDGLDKCPDTPEGVDVDANGCPLDGDNDGVPNYMDQCPNTLPGIKVNKHGCPLRKQEDLDYLKKGIQFEFGSAKLLESSFPVLDAIIVLLEKIPEVKLEVQGHTDIVGTEDYNQKLSEDRAHSVTTYMESKGVAAERLRAIGFGTRMPLADNVSDEGRAKNRRVELIPFGYYTEGEGTVAAPSDSLLNNSTEVKTDGAAVPAEPANGSMSSPTGKAVKPGETSKVKVKLKERVSKVVRSATKAASRKRKADSATVDAGAEQGRNKPAEAPKPAEVLPQP